MPAFLAPYTYIPDPLGDRALFLGEAFFGQPNTDPLVPANRIIVRKVEDDGSFTNLSQPVQIGPGGVFEDAGSPVFLDIVENRYSVLIRDRNDTQRYSFASAGPGGTTGRQVLLNQGGLPFDNTVATTGPTLTIDPLIHTNALILCDSSSNNITLNLPSAALTGDKFRFYVKKRSNDSNLVTIDPAGGDRIDLQATLAISEQHEVLEIVTDGTNWWNVGGFLRANGIRLRAVETRSTTNQTNISTNSTAISGLEAQPRVLAAARTSDAGTITYGFNLSVNKPPGTTGRYDYTFSTALPSGVAGDYVAVCTPATGGITNVGSYSATGFQVNIGFVAQPNDAGGRNAQHSVVVFADPGVFTA